MERWSFLVEDSKILEALYKSDLDFEDLQEKGILEIQTINEFELYRYTEGMFKLESEIYKEKFNEGDETAIFEFCRNHYFAFRSNWVVSQIEKWKLESSKESSNCEAKLGFKGMVEVGFGQFRANKTLNSP